MSWDFFIAHAGPDRKAAEELHTELERRHAAKSFVDTRNLAPGDEWQSALKRALIETRVTVVLVSANSDNAYYQQEEVALAIDLAREGTEAHRIVPVLLKGARRTNVPYGLARLHALQEDDGGLARVADELAALLDAPSSRPPTAPLAHAVELLDEVWSRAEPAFSGGPRRHPDEFGLTYRREGDDLVARYHGTEQQRITRDEFEKRLTPDQLRYIAVLEKSMEVNLALWERKYPNRALSADEAAEADRALGAMGEDLAGVIDALEESGFHLDDHYWEVRRHSPNQLSGKPRSREEPR